MDLGRLPVEILVEERWMHTVVSAWRCSGVGQRGSDSMGEDRVGLAWARPSLMVLGVAGGGVYGGLRGL